MAAVHAHTSNIVSLLQLRLHFIQSVYCHLHIYSLLQSCQVTENPAVSSSLRCACYFNPPTRSIKTIHLNAAHRFAYLCCRIHMSIGFSPQVGFHLNHHLILHRQPGCLPHSPEDGGPN